MSHIYCGNNVSEVPVLSTSSNSSAQSQICHVGHSARLTAVTCSFRGQTRPSAAKFLHCGSCRLDSGTHFHLTFTHHTSVAGSSDRSWRLTFSDKPITLHDSSENSSVEEWNSVIVSVMCQVYSRSRHLSDTYCHVRLLRMYWVGEWVSSFLAAGTSAHFRLFSH